ncbi:Ubiquitinyl hydrolase 1 [Apiospora marii]|uniref:ubiquitinyl hydrolase 1 n=1 Tax=Apiospora marii TaxID=335849 RepID=A0ABR1S7R6_9PEZI
MADLDGPQGKENTVVVRDNALALLNEKREAHVRVGEIKFVCVVDGCYCSVDVVALNPVLSNLDIDNFQDQNRARRNLAAARREDPERFHDTANGFGDNAIDIFLKYVRDGLQTSEGQRRIRKRNKKFMACFGSDFDPLFRSLGFKETSEKNEVTGEFEESWLFPGMDRTTTLTCFDTLRAKWEDSAAELRALLQRRNIPLEGPPLQQAWKSLAARIRTDYEHVQIPIGHRKEDDKDFDLLGCWTDYTATLFVGVAILLGDKCPSRADEFWTAAKSIIANRSWDGTCFFSLTQLVEKESLHQAALDSTKSHEMGPKDAAELLGVELNYPAELIQGFVNNLAAALAKDPAKTEKAAKAIEALQILANYKRGNGDSAGEQEARELESLAGVFQSYTSAEAQQWYGMPGLEATQPADQGASYKNTPPGLHNIGNTCYLNSLLQYLYNVKPIRDVVLHHDQDRLELTPESVGARRIGVMESLAQLFVDLQTTKEVSAQPSQKLANTALKSANALLAPKQQTEPPPLPARPSPAAPTETQQDVDMINVTVEPLVDTNDVPSSMSSQTLVNDSEATSMGSYVEINVPSEADDKARKAASGGEESPKVSHVEIKPDDLNSIEETSYEEKYQIISERLEQSDRKGTNQNDVGEIVGNVLEHLMRSIQSDGPVPGRPDLQSDKITRTFFPMFVNYSHRKDEATGAETESKEVIPDRWLSAFPHSTEGVKRTIYEALDEATQISFVNATLARSTVYQSLPPILHICIQRTGSTKNRNSVLIEDVLYMDRYMEADPNTALAERRRQAALIKMRLAQIRGSPKEESSLSKTNAATDVQLPQNSEDEITWIDPYSLDWDDLVKFAPSKTEPDLESLKRKAHGTPHTVRKRSPQGQASGLSCELAQELASTVQDQDKSDAEERKNLEAELSQLFNGFRNEKYLLHAVICHGGGVTAGHYWVWIRDFKKNVWLKYNDSIVTEDSRDSQAVLDELNAGGDPYYLAYVREDMRDEMVDVPQRAVVPDDSNDVPDAPGHVIEMETIEGIEPASLITIKEQPEPHKPDSMEVDEPAPYQVL